jgi:hypothetical protein
MSAGGGKLEEIAASVLLVCDALGHHLLAERAECAKWKHNLYRHYDENGKLLHVGVSISAMKRLADHRHRAHWFDRIARMEVEKFPTREASLAAETNAIRAENPECNIVLRLRSGRNANADRQARYRARRKAHAEASA